MTDKDKWVVAVHKDGQLIPVAVCHEDDLETVCQAFSTYKGNLIKWQVKQVSKDAGQ